MTTWHRLLLGLLLLAPGGASPAQAPAGLSAAQLEQAVADTLKEVHNRGADLYNRGDPAGAYRMYEGALSSVRPFVAHRPAILKAIEDGLNETAKADGVKVQAFRLHQLIEQVRADLKAELARPPEVKPPAPEPPAKPAPATTPAKPTEAPKVPAKATPLLAGTLTLQGKPLAATDVTLVSLDQKLLRVFTATTTDAGRYEFAEIPGGPYAVMVTGKGVPAKYTTVGTSPLRTVVAAQPSQIDLKLE